MTMTASPGLPDELLQMSEQDRDALLCRTDPGIWAERRLGHVNADFQWEWYSLMMREVRLCLVAPREHAKTEIVTVNGTAWRSIYRPGTWTYVFGVTGEKAKELKARITEVVEHVQPSLVGRARKNTDSEIRFSNGSRLSVAGAGSAVRGAHPDIIIGDDVLEEKTTLTSYQRKKTESWWKGTVGGMAHPGTLRKTGYGRTVRMPPTRIFLVGTPFHDEDLLLSMKRNPMYRFYRYAAEYDPADLVPGTHAVEVA